MRYSINSAPFSRRNRVLYFFILLATGQIRIIACRSNWFTWFADYSCERKFLFQVLSHQSSIASGYLHVDYYQSLFKTCQLLTSARCLWEHDWHAHFYHGLYINITRYKQAFCDDWSHEWQKLSVNEHEYSLQINHCIRLLFSLHSLKE